MSTNSSTLAKALRLGRRRKKSPKGPGSDQREEGRAKLRRLKAWHEERQAILDAVVQFIDHGDKEPLRHIRARLNELSSDNRARFAAAVDALFFDVKRVTPEKSKLLKRDVEIAMEVNALVEQGRPKTAAHSLVAEKLGLSERTVRRAVAEE